MEEDRGDVISLVDSEEEVFENTVPRLPPVTNGLHTTHAEIHPVPVGEYPLGPSVPLCPIGGVHGMTSIKTVKGKQLLKEVQCVMENELVHCLR